MKNFDPLIQPPPRSSLSGTALVLTTSILLSIIPLSHFLGLWAGAIGVLLVLAGLLLRERDALLFAFFTTLLAIIPLLHPLLAKWPFGLLVPMLIYLALDLTIPRFRSTLQWLRPGRLNKDIMILLVLFGTISGIALYAWLWTMKPDLSLHLGHMPSMSIWLFPAAGLSFAIGNAALEECVFRGLVMQTLDRALGAEWASILIQGWLFGAMHYVRGFPNGAWGLGMTMIFGIMLGVLRRRSQGMLAPWLAHMCADLIIFAILANIVLS